MRSAPCTRVHSECSCRCGHAGESPGERIALLVGRVGAEPEHHHVAERHVVRVLPEAVVAGEPALERVAASLQALVGAAVDGEGGTDDEAGVLGAQEGDQRTEVVGVAHHTGGHAGGGRGGVAAVERAQAVGGV